MQIQPGNERLSLFEEGIPQQTHGMHNGRYYWFSYQAPARNLRRKQYLHLIRDGAAFAELVPVLMSMGYGYGGLVLNFPSRQSLATQEIDIPALTPADLLVLPTRPPLSDEEEDERRKVARSHTRLEQMVLFRTGSVF